MPSAARTGQKQSSIARITGRIERRNRIELDPVVERVHRSRADRVAERFQIRRGGARDVDVEIRVDPGVVHVVFVCGDFTTIRSKSRGSSPLEKYIARSNRLSVRLNTTTV
jgi:hypothetical protein